MENIKKAILIIKENKKCTASLFERELGISFTQARDICRKLEMLKIIGFQFGANERKINRDEINKYL